MFDGVCSYFLLSESGHITREQKVPEAWPRVKCCATEYLPGIRPGLKIPCPHTNSRAQTALSDRKLGRIAKDKHEAMPDSSFRKSSADKAGTTLASEISSNFQRGSISALFPGP